MCRLAHSGPRSGGFPLCGAAAPGARSAPDRRSLESVLCTGSLQVCAAKSPSCVCGCVEFVPGRNLLCAHTYNLVAVVSDLRRRCASARPKQGCPLGSVGRWPDRASRDGRAVARCGRGAASRRASARPVGVRWCPSSVVADMGARQRLESAAPTALVAVMWNREPGGVRSPHSRTAAGARRSRPRRSSDAARRAVGPSCSIHWFQCPPKAGSCGSFSGARWVEQQFDQRSARADVGPP